MYLIFFFHDREEYKSTVNYIAMGIFSLANELQKNKFKTEIIHLGIEKALNLDFDIAKHIKDNKIKIIGISLNWHYQAYDALNVAQHIKINCPDCFIFLGGLTCSAFADEILKKYPYIDAIIKGEGEKPVVELVTNIINDNYNLSYIPNLYWKDKNGKIHKNKKTWFANEQELNEYKFDNLKLLKNYDLYLKMTLIYNKVTNKPDIVYFRNPKNIFCCLGRGCLGNCTWCGGGYNAIKEITGRDTISIRDPKIVAQEILHLKQEYDIETFSLCYDPCPPKQDFAIDLFNILGKEMPKKINLSFECFGLPNKEFIDSFKQNLEPNSVIVISPDFGDEKTRQVHKSFYYSNEELLKCLDYIKNKDIKTHLYFARTDFEKEYQTLSFIDTYIKDNYNNVSCFINAIKDIEPYSPWAINPEKYNCPYNKKLDFEYFYRASKAYRDFI